MSARGGWRPWRTSWFQMENRRKSRWRTTSGDPTLESAACSAQPSRGRGTAITSLPPRFCHHRRINIGYGAASGPRSGAALGPYIGAAADPPHRGAPKHVAPIAQSPPITQSSKGQVGEDRRKPRRRQGRRGKPTKPVTVALDVVVGATEKAELTWIEPAKDVFREGGHRGQRRCRHHRLGRQKTTAAASTTAAGDCGRRVLEGLLEATCQGEQKPRWDGLRIRGGQDQQQQPLKEVEEEASTVADPAAQRGAAAGNIPPKSRGGPTRARTVAIFTLDGTTTHSLCQRHR